MDNLTKLNMLEASIKRLGELLPMYRLAGDTIRANEASEQLYTLKRVANQLRNAL